MIYYEKIEIDEHFLYAEEIAKACGVLSANDKPHSKLIKAIILDYEKKNSIAHRDIHYNTRHGLREVFNPYIAGQAMNQFLIENKNNTIYNSLNGVLYKFKFKV